MHTRHRSVHISWVILPIISRCRLLKEQNPLLMVPIICRRQCCQTDAPPPPISYVYMTLMILHVIVWCWLQDAHKPHHMREDLSWWCFPLSYITFTKLASHDWCCLVNAHMPRLMRAGLFMLPFIYQCCLAIVHSLGLMSMSHRKHATTKRANICSLSLSNVALSMRTCLRLCRMFDALKPRLKLLNRCAHDTTDAFRP